MCICKTPVFTYRDVALRSSITKCLVTALLPWFSVFTVLLQGCKFIVIPGAKPCVLGAYAPKIAVYLLYLLLGIGES